MFNSTMNGRPTGLVSALESLAEERRRGYAKDIGLDGTGGGEEINVGDGARSRSGAKRTDLEIRVRARMMVVCHAGHCRHIHR